MDFLRIVNRSNAIVKITIWRYNIYIYIYCIYLSPYSHNRMILISNICYSLQCWTVLITLSCVHNCILSCQMAAGLVLQNNVWHGELKIMPKCKGHPKELNEGMAMKPLKNIQCSQNRSFWWFFQQQRPSRTSLHSNIILTMKIASRKSSPIT